MKISAKIKRKSVLIGILFAMLIIAIVYAAEYYQINSGAQVTINEHGVCKKVTNNNALAIFVPTKTADEWAAFRTYASGLTYVGCCQQDTDWGGASEEGCIGSDKRCFSGSCITCGGWMNAGYCWYLGGNKESCTSVCSARGGLYHDGVWSNDPSDCSTAKHWYPSYSCSGAYLSGPDAEHKWYRVTSYGGDSSLIYIGVDYNRMCACNQ